MSNKLTKMAKELLAIEEDMPFRFERLNPGMVKVDDFEMITFNQIWGSTALGFGGVGGQAITEARTYVFIPMISGHKCLVYFGDRFAYKAPYCEALKEDIRNHQMASVAESGKYIK